MPGLAGLYEQMDRTVEAPCDGGPAEPPPMLMCLLYVAEPIGLRTCRDLDEAREKLGWVQLVWNLVRMRTEHRQEFIDEWANDLLDFTVTPHEVIEMTVRALAWPTDRRVVAEARIDVDPTGAWRVAVASVVPPRPTSRRSSAP